MRLCIILVAAFVLNVVSSDDAPGEASTLSLVDEVLEKCLLNEDMDGCLQEEAASALGRALKVDSIPLASGLYLTKAPGQEEPPQLESTGRSEGKSAYEKIWENLDKLVSSRSLTLQLSDISEGRGKKKKAFRYYAVAIATAAAILIPIKLKFIGWMAATALMIGKIALVLASLVGLKKLVSKPQEETTHVHYDSHRSDEAQYLAYSGQQPNLIPE